MSTIHADEIEWICQLQSGSDEAFRLFVRKYRPMLWRLTGRYLSNWSDREDVIQLTFLSVVRSIAQFSGRCQLSTWLYRIAINGCLLVLRKQRRSAMIVSDESISEHDGPLCDPIESLLRKETIQSMHRAIAALPKNQREIVVMRVIEGRQIADCARRLGLSKVAVKARYFRARNSLRGLLSLDEVSPSPHHDCDL